MGLTITVVDRVRLNEHVAKKHGKELETAARNENIERDNIHVECNGCLVWINYSDLAAACTKVKAKQFYEACDRATRKYQNEEGLVHVYYWW